MDKDLELTDSETEYYTDTEDSDSVDLEDEDLEEDDEEDLRQGQIEYEKYKHTLNDFIVPDEIEDSKEEDISDMPVKKRKRE